MRRVAIIACALLLGGCGVQGPRDASGSRFDDWLTQSPPGWASGTGDDDDDNLPPDPRDDWEAPMLTHGLEYVRGNPLSLSGLVVQMPSPPTAAVDAYFSDFGANTIHLWEDGLPTLMDAWRGAAPADAHWIVWTHADGTSFVNGEVIGGYPPNVSGRVGYQVGDEPRTPADYDEVVAGMETVRAADPDALVYLNFSYLADDIDTFLADYGATEGDVVSYDDYTRSNHSYERLELFRTAALEHGMPYWRYLKSFEPADCTESDMRWELMSGLVYGYTGQTWFTYQITSSNTELPPALFDAAGSWSATPTERFDVAALLNEQAKNLGRVITQLTSTDVRYIPHFDFLQPGGTSTWEPGAGGDPYLAAVAPAGENDVLDVLVGFFRDDAGELYLMVQNVRHANGDFPVKSAAPGEIRLGFDFTDAHPAFARDHLEMLDATTGEIADLPLIATGENTADVVLDLDAGEARLLKYATDGPWAMGPEP